MRTKVAACLFFLGLAFVMGAQAQTRKTQAETLERYAKYAGDPIGEFQFWSLYKWALAGPTKVLVWPNINEAYLISVEDPCPVLNGQRASASRRSSRAWSAHASIS